MEIYGKNSGVLYGALYVEKNRAIYVPSPNVNIETSIAEATAMAWEQRQPILSGILKPEHALRYELLVDHAATTALSAATTSDSLPRTRGIGLTPDILDTTQEDFRKRISQAVLESVQQQHAAQYIPRSSSAAPVAASPQPALLPQQPVPAAAPANPQKFVIGPWSKK